MFLLARTAFKHILEGYRGYKHYLAGHSLGGTINKYLRSVFGDAIHEVHNFNPGAGLGAVLKAGFNWLTGKNDPNSHDHFVKGDPLSVLGHLDPGSAAHHREAEEGSHPHSVDQFY